MKVDGERGRKEGRKCCVWGCCFPPDIQPASQPVSRDSCRWGWPRLFIQNFWWLPTGADELRLSLLRLVVCSRRPALIGWDSGHCPVLATGDRPWPRGSLTNREAGVGWMQRASCVSHWSGRVWLGLSQNNFISPVASRSATQHTLDTALRDLLGSHQPGRGIRAQL